MLLATTHCFAVPTKDSAEVAECELTPVEPTGSAGAHSYSSCKSATTFGRVPVQLRWQANSLKSGFATQLAVAINLKPRELAAPSASLMLLPLH